MVLFPSLTLSLSAQSPVLAFNLQLPKSPIAHIPVTLYAPSPPSPRRHGEAIRLSPSVSRSLDNPDPSPPPGAFPMSRATPSHVAHPVHSPRALYLSLYMSLALVVVKANQDLGHMLHLFCQPPCILIIAPACCPWFLLSLSTQRPGLNCAVSHPLSPSLGHCNLSQHPPSHEYSTTPSCSTLPRPLRPCRVCRADTLRHLLLSLPLPF
jgi:hypothetical protein